MSFGTLVLAALLRAHGASSEDLIGLILRLMMEQAACNEDNSTALSNAGASACNATSIKIMPLSAHAIRVDSRSDFSTQSPE